MTSPDEKEELRRWVGTWRRAGPELEAVRRRELAAFDFASNWRLVDDLLAAGLRSAEPRVTSGLVELQRCFMEIARKQHLVPGAVRESRDRYGATDAKEGHKPQE